MKELSEYVSDCCGASEKGVTMQWTNKDGE